MERNSLKTNKFAGFTIRNTLTAILLVLSFSVFLSGCGVSQEKIDEADKLTEEAEDLTEDYQFADAMNKYEEAVKLNDEDEDIYKGIAEIYLLKNRESDALEVLNTGIERTDADALYALRGKLHFTEDDFDAAIEDLKKALEKNNGNSIARYYLAFSYVNEGDFEKARKYLDLDRISDDEIKAEAAILKAVVLRTQTAQAREILEDVNKENLSDQTIQKVNKYLDTLDYLEQITQEELTDKYKDIILAKGAIELSIEEVAIDLLEKYIETDEEYWEVHLYLGQAYYLNDDIRKSKDFFNESVSLNPGSYLSPWMLGRVYYKEDNIDKFEESYLRSIELASVEERVPIRDEFARLAFENERYSVADEQYEKLAEEDAELKDMYLLKRAEIAYQRGLIEDMEEIISRVETSQMSDENLAQYYYYKSVLALELGEKEEALKWIEDAVALDNKSATYYLLYGQILFEMDRNEEAEKYFQDAIDYDLTGDVSSKALKFLDRI